jgi:hypothetical protein
MPSASVLSHQPHLPLLRMTRSAPGDPHPALLGQADRQILQRREKHQPDQKRQEYTIRHGVPGNLIEWVGFLALEYSCCYCFAWSPFPRNRHLVVLEDLLGCNPGACEYHGHARSRVCACAHEVGVLEQAGLGTGTLVRTLARVNRFQTGTELLYSLPRRAEEREVTNLRMTRR